MLFNRKQIVAALFASCLTIVTLAVDAATVDVDDCNSACRSMRAKKIELQRDERDLASDVRLLRRSLRHHVSHDRIESLRYLVREDWGQIVTDRSQATVF